jgi:hypothetical protein
MNLNLPKPTNLKECDNIDWCILCHYGEIQKVPSICIIRKEFLKDHNPFEFMEFNLLV